MSRKIEKLAIANRGEVAVRIIRAAQEMGIQSVLLHSEADVETLAYRIADERVLIGGSPVSESYLNIEKNIDGAKSVEADAIHPGFGFLSENADFAKACDKAKIIFVGPSAESIELFGDKISAKNLVNKVGAPTIPGYQGEDQDVRTLISQAKEIGFPVMVKAAGGGGGRGLRVIKDEDSAKEIIDSARREARNAFGSEKLFLEKYLDKAKHIEVQIFGDSSGKAYHLFERECSVQRRHQKVIEEAGAADFDPTIRQKMLTTAVEIAEHAKYKGAGTIEFLLQDGEFYFLEMNTRLQVEHPVTEMILGVDLVKAQIQTAEGQSLLWSQEDLRPSGHAIECRLYAEDSYKQGMPSTGTLGSTYYPMGPGRRFEIGFETGDEITSYYDSMIGKVVVWDESRYRAIRKMKETLKQTVIFGLKTNIPYLLDILSHYEFVDGKMTTRFIETHYPEGLAQQEITEDDLELAEILKPQVTATNSEKTSIPNPWTSKWSKS